jgi:hypothetical protein
MRGCQLDLSVSEQHQIAGSTKHCYEPSRSIKSGEFLVQLSDYEILKKSCMTCVMVTHLVFSTVRRH